MSKTKIWAHRGASGDAPENTLEAFLLAVEQGADGVELDVQLTKDGEIVVIHDETIDRTSNGKGYVKDYTLEELKQFNFNRTNPSYDQAAIPTLREVFETLKDTDLTVNIELKNSVIFYKDLEEKVIELVKSTGMEKRVIYSSFNHYSMMHIKELDAQAKIGFLYADGYIDMPLYGKKYHADALHPALYNLSYKDFISQCKEQGLKLHVWTVNEEADMKALAEAGIDAIITNEPGKCRWVLK